MERVVEREVQRVVEKVVGVSVERSIASNQCISLFFILVLGMLLGSQGISAAEDEEIATQSSYVAIEPALVTNYGGPGRLRYMSVEVSLRVSGVEAENSVSHHMPQIKDTLLNLFAVQTNETIETAESKETLRQQSFEAVSSVLLEEEKEMHLQDILFTSFVVYR